MPTGKVALLGRLPKEVAQFGLLAQIINTSGQQKHIPAL
jgi:hypothetical protein